MQLMGKWLKVNAGRSEFWEWSRVRQRTDRAG